MNESNIYSHLLILYYKNMSGGLFFMDYEIMMNGNVKLRTDGARDRSKFNNGKHIFK